ncbi:MAG: malonic semialdehyde reductase [Burkholderiales bacterium]|nr:malonic semialdehyde reductase [Burkholderiales bacterium]
MLDDRSLAVLFRAARTHNGFLDHPVTDQDLRALYDLNWESTTMNSQPARFVFVRSREAKEKLRPALSPGNVEKTMAAPVTAIVAYDLRFYENLPRTFPNNPHGRAAFEGKKAHIATTALRNASLQGAYLILAAPALGLDCGPMSGFDNAAVDAAFFPDGRWTSNFLCNRGRGDPAKVYSRNLRLSFEEACRIA